MAETRKLYPWLVLGIAIRLLCILPGHHHSDLTLVREWGVKANIYGILTVYDTARHYDVPGYPPLVPCLAWAMDNAGNALKRIFGDFDAFQWLYKLFLLAVDVAIMLLIFRFLNGTLRAALLATLFFLNPGVILDGVVWGQMDNLLVLFIAASLIAILRQRPLIAGLCFGLACLTKMQAAVFAPLLLVLALQELRPAGALKSALAAGLTFFLFCAPFMAVGRFGLILSFFATSASLCPYFSVNAFNLFWLLSGGTGFVPDSRVLALGLSAKTAGLLIFAAGYAAAILSLLSDPPGKNRCAAFAFLAFAFYMLPTQMHERYLFPFFVFFLMADPARKRDAVLYIALSLLFSVNLAAVFSVNRGCTGFLNAHFHVIAAAAASLNLALFLYYSAQTLSRVRFKAVREALRLNPQNGGPA